MRPRFGVLVQNGWWFFLGVLNVLFGCFCVAFQSVSRSVPCAERQAVSQSVREHAGQSVGDDSYNYY